MLIAPPAHHRRYTAVIFPDPETHRLPLGSLAADSVYIFFFFAFPPDLLVVRPAWYKNAGSQRLSVVAAAVREQAVIAIQYHFVYVSTGCLDRLGFDPLSTVVSVIGVLDLLRFWVVLADLHVHLSHEDLWTSAPQHHYCTLLYKNPADCLSSTEER